MNRKSVLGVLVTATAALALTACGDSGTPSAGAPTSAAPVSPAAASAAHNAADIAFVQGMIPHHSQAVDMAKLAPAKAGNEQVKQLAARIEQAQGPEIAQMRGFLTAWSVPESPGGMAGMSGMSGMMTDAQMQQLGQATGAAFDRMFLQMMTEHHKGAIQMAQTELASGQNPEAKALAQKIIADQQAEIAEMQRLLTSV